MTEFAEKLVPVVTAIEAEKGPVDLFALFLPEESAGFWDIVVAAPWVAGDISGAIWYVAGLVQKALSPDELGQLSHVTVVRAQTAALFARLGEVKPDDVPRHASGFAFGNVEIKDAWVLALRRPGARKRRKPVASR